jgi:hypothetical protein
MSVKTVITETSGFFRKPSSVIHIDRDKETRYERVGEADRG